MTVVQPAAPPLACGGLPRGRGGHGGCAELLTPGPLRPDPPSSADSSEDGRGGARVELGFSGPGGRVAVGDSGLRRRAELSDPARCGGRKVRWGPCSGCGRQSRAAGPGLHSGS